MSPKPPPRRKPGRRPQPPILNRTILIKVLVRKSEYDELRNRAGEKSLSSYLREKGLGL